MFSRRCIAFVSTLALAGCDSGTSSEDEGASAWEGETPHFTAVGTIEGEAIDVHLTGADAADTTKLWCEREYAVPLRVAEGGPDGGVGDLSAAQFVEVKVDGIAMFGEQERMFEIELKKHSLQTDANGDQITVVPRDDLAGPAPGEMWFEWEWHDVETTDELSDVAAQEGTVTRGMFTGTPGEGGVIIPENEGVVGAHVDARWSVDDSIQISFSAKCTSNKIEFEEPQP